MTFLLCGVGSFAVLPLNKISKKIHWIEFLTVGDSGWRGNRIYLTWFDRAKKQPTIPYHQLLEISPQISDGVKANPFPALFIANPNVLVISRMGVDFFKAKMSSSDQIDDVLDGLADFDGHYVDIVMDARNKDLFGQFCFKLFELIDTNDSSEPLPNLKQLVVHDSDGMYDRNYLGIDELTFTGYFYEFEDFDYLPIDKKSYSVSVGSTYKSRVEVDRLIAWLSKCNEMEHLVIYERLGILERLIELVMMGRGTKEFASTWSKLQTVKATLSDDPLGLCDLFELPATHTVVFAFGKMNNDIHMKQEAEDSDWRRLKKPFKHGTLIWVEFVNKHGKIVGRGKEEGEDYRNRQKQQQFPLKGASRRRQERRQQ